MKTSVTIIAVLVLSALIMAYTGSRTITGKVTDDGGKPLQGVSVAVKGDRERTETDASGIYRITTTRVNITLIFSYKGLRTVEVNIGDRNVMNVKMTPEGAKRPEAVIAVPAGEERDGKSTGRVYSTRSDAAAGVHNISSFPGSRGNFNTEGYASVAENGYKAVRQNPLSTFSIDVDNASYSNIRRFINLGELPPPEAVRVEEMINYFRYDYPEPSGKQLFSVSTELAVCPWNKEHLLLQLGLHGKSIDKASLPSSNLVFLIDVSGSMNAPNKLPLLKSAFGLLVNELRPSDKVAIVVYAGAAGLVLESTPGNRKESIKDAIDNLRAGGSTAGGEGLRLAYTEAGKNYIYGGNNRIILATDGDFNVGESSNGAMERLVEEKRKEGIFITVLGFGMGNVKDDKMEIIADKGNGNYSYIDNLQEARRVLVREFGGTLFTIAKDVKLQVEFNPRKVESYRLIGYENRMLESEDFNNDRKDAGEMGSGHNVTALYELIPAGSDENVPSVDPLKYQSNDDVNTGGRYDSDYRNEFLTVKIRYKNPESNTSLLMVKPVSGSPGAIRNASDNIRFAAAVAEFGMILRNSEFRGNSSLEDAASMARSARGEDEDGYRAEFVRLVQTVRDMKIQAGSE